jgi:hypothetical protein
MLLPDNIHPRLSLYYNGGLVIEALTKLRESALVDLFVEVRKLHDITMPIFVLSLDWLYIIDLVKLNSRGNIELCS